MLRHKIIIIKQKKNRTQRGRRRRRRKTKGKSISLKRPCKNQILNLRALNEYIKSILKLT